MKAITLYQPWATLVAIGAKKIETRSWPSRYRGPLAIHASKKYTQRMKEIERCPFFKEALYPNGIYLYPWASCGSVIAICDLVECHLIEYGNSGPWKLISDQERAFGDYNPGRYMWMLENIKKLETPIPTKGAMGLWEWDSENYGIGARE